MPVHRNIVQVELNACPTGTDRPARKQYKSVRRQVLLNDWIVKLLIC